MTFGAKNFFMSFTQNEKSHGTSGTWTTCTSAWVSLGFQKNSTHPLPKNSRTVLRAFWPVLQPNTYCLHIHHTYKAYTHTTRALRREREKLSDFGSHLFEYSSYRPPKHALHNACPGPNVRKKRPTHTRRPTPSLSSLYLTQKITWALKYCLRVGGHKAAYLSPSATTGRTVVRYVLSYSICERYVARWVVSLKHLFDSMMRAFTRPRVMTLDDCGQCCS